MTPQMDQLAQPLIGEPLPAPWLVRWLTWPVIFCGSLGAALLAMRQGANIGMVSGGVIFLSAAGLIVLEQLYPLKHQWRGNWREFLHRDLKYFATAGVSIAATNALFGLIGIQMGAGHAGPITGWPLYFSVPAGLIAVDFLQYWQHRISHEAKGVFGHWLWRVHVAHHLPDKVYILMHPAGHPINGFIVRGLVTILPLYFLGATAETVALVTLIIGVQGLVSHTNIDLRAGWLNYMFAGSELHRVHHSADEKDAGNYAVALSLLDILFGTFIYHPGKYPRQIGVLETAAYPPSNKLWQVLMLPFSAPRGLGAGNSLCRKGSPAQNP